MMTFYTGWEYLLIDVANNSNLSLDKELFEDRIKWVEDNLDSLELLAVGQQWKERPMFIKAVSALRKSQEGKPTGHLVGFDAVCSGMQIMSALTGCVHGAAATGLIDPNRRADAYSDCTKLMAKELNTNVLAGDRNKVKQAVMTSLYGSKEEPKKEFGEDTKELEAFYKAMYTLCPGACDLLDELLQSWQPYALYHEWRLPDGFLAHVKVMQKVDDCRIEVDEIDHATFTYQYYVNEGEKKGVKNAANVVHSIDAYILRSLIRRCNYNEDTLILQHQCIAWELIFRLDNKCGHSPVLATPETDYYAEHYQRSGIADIVILPYLDNESVQALTTDHLKSLQTVINSMLEHDSFEIVTVHDDFKCHANYMNHLRAHYRDIMAELADSNLIGDILGQLHGMEGTYQKLSSNLSDQIRQSNYALS
jgi:hypothetical protein